MTASARFLLLLMITKKTDDLERISLNGNGNWIMDGEIRSLT